jgi:hypothetical protein
MPADERESDIVALAYMLKYVEVELRESVGTPDLADRLRDIRHELKRRKLDA